MNLLSREEYKNYCKRFKQVYLFLQSNSKPQPQVVKEICMIREYYPERMSNILSKAGFLFIEDDTCYEKLKNAGGDLGLFTSEGKFLLAGRYIFPVFDMLGNIIALIGWYPDSKKYITTPSKLFSKSCLFYGIEQLSTTGINQKYVLVEGIFDCLSVRSLGIPCIAQMGIDSSRYKSAMYSLFNMLLGIPDNDEEGRDVIAFDKWSLPSNSKYFKWTGDSSKDIDKLCNSYEEEDVRELLLSAFDKRKRIVVENL